MALRKLKHIEIEDDFKLIGIHCQLDGYKLAFNLNKFLRISLENFDYKIVIDNVECAFEMFKHKSETYNTKIYLFSNKSFGNIQSYEPNLFDNINSNVYLIDEKKSIDFFLKIEGGSFNYTSLMNKINEIPMVQSCYLINLKSQKSKYNLIFE
mgnify:CR=1 FL=1